MRKAMTSRFRRLRRDGKEEDTSAGYDQANARLATAEMNTKP